MVTFAPAQHPFTQGMQGYIKPRLAIARATQCLSAAVCDAVVEEIVGIYVTGLRTGPEKWKALRQSCRAPDPDQPTSAGP
jgi:hypothetical protein